MQNNLGQSIAYTFLCAVSKNSFEISYNLIYFHVYYADGICLEFLHVSTQQEV